MNEKQIGPKSMPPITFFKVEFDMVLKISTNKIYSGVHYRTRIKHKKMYQWEVLRVCKKEKIKPINNYPVILKFTFYFDKNLLDSSNCSYMAKLIEDALVHEGVFINDTPQYISRVSTQSKRGPKGQNKIILEVLPNEEYDHQSNSRPVCKKQPSSRKTEGGQQETLF